MYFLSYVSEWVDPDEKNSIIILCLNQLIQVYVSYAVFESTDPETMHLVFFNCFCHVYVFVSVMKETHKCVRLGRVTTTTSTHRELQQQQNDIGESSHREIEDVSYEDMSTVDVHVEMPPLPPPSLEFLESPISMLGSFKDHVPSHI